jgi:hypothetical protein
MASDPRAGAEVRPRRVQRAIDAALVSAAVAFVLWQLHPSLLVSSTTPSGGDMGAHVWGPIFLRDELLPNLRLTGWSPDWYAGFPAFQFYMVVPALFIVILNAGVHGWVALVPAAIGVGLAVLAWRRRDQRLRRNAAVTGSVVALAAVGLSYGVAFKWLSISGLLALPIAAYAFGRLSDLRFPTPAVLAVATLPFLFYRGFTIFGGNIASTLAGEFAYSISLSLALLYLGVVMRGLRTGQYRALAAVLLALVGLTHLIVAFWALVATAFVVLVCYVRPRVRPAGEAKQAAGDGPWALRQARPTEEAKQAAGDGPWALWQAQPADDARQSASDDAWQSGSADGAGHLAGARAGACVGCFGVGFALIGAALLLGPGFGFLGGTLLLAVGGLGLLAVVAGLWFVWAPARWLTPVMVVAGLLSAFWVLPFYLRRTFMNDMGWEKLPGVDESIWDHLLPSETAVVDLRWVFGLAVAGALLSVALRLRAGLFLAVTTLAVAVAFLVMPEGRLWNGRILPFYYLALVLLAGLAVSEAARMLAVVVRGDGRREPLGTGRLVAPLSLAVVLVIVGLPLGNLPFTDRSDEGLSWPWFSPWRLRAETESFVPSWARWNYSGFEEKDAYPEYRNVIQTMQEVGQDPDHGCGRAFWEFSPDLDRFGTPMALMLLPHWTDGCIGSMEGLFFESSATTPFHFLTQVELSAEPSAAQRDLPYGSFDIERGVDHLQLMGVRYYLASSEQAVSAARQHPDLSEIASTPPWVVFQVTDSPLVQPLAFEPAVLDGVSDRQSEWLEGSRDADGRFNGPAVRWFTDPAQWNVPLASSGLDDWQRVGADVRPEARPVDDAVTVSGVHTDTDSISFQVDQVGTPILVKTSYFPNWQVEGAEGPYRVTPNFMVVVPTDSTVELSYGQTSVEWLSYALTVAGLVGLAMLARRPAWRAIRSDTGARRE